MQMWIPPIVILAVLAYGLLLLLRPNLYLNFKYTRQTFNPNLLNSPCLQMRVIGLAFSLFALLVGTALMGRSGHPEFFKRFVQFGFGGLTVLFCTVWVGSVLLWVLEKFKVIQPTLKERYDRVGPQQDVIRQGREPVILCSLLAIILAGCAFSALLK